MARKLRNVASRGSVNNIILESLMTGQKYGYEIIKEVEEKTNGKVKLKQPSLYSSLKRFESKNIITSYWGDSDIGGRRHYYLLTDYGRKYYENQMHKHDDDDFDETDFDEQPLNEDESNVEVVAAEQAEQEYIIDKPDDDEIDLNEKYNSFSVEDKMRELLGDEIEPQQTPTLSHPRDTFNEDVRDTLIENNQTLQDNSNEKEILDELYDAMDKDELENPKEEFVATTIEQVPDHSFYKPVPLSEYKNEKYEESYNILFNNEQIVEHKITPQQEEKPQEVIATRKKKIITDEYGITKLVYEDEEDWKTNKQNFTIKTNTNNINIDLVKLANNKQSKNILDELTDEEREERNMRFVRKFDDITSERLTPTPQTEQIQLRDDVNYKDKLDSLLTDNTQSQPEIEAAPCLEDNCREVETQHITRKLTDTIDDDSINVKVYTKSREAKSDKKYLQINKAKFAFGIVMLVLMLIELTAAMIIMKANGTLYKDKMWAFKVGYGIAVVVCLFYCIPVFVSPNKQTANTFKLNYAIVFGLLAFLVSLILIYTINTFMGLDFDNIKYFAPTLIAPLVLVSNFIVGPLLYKVITLNSRLYQ